MRKIKLYNKLSLYSIVLAVVLGIVRSVIKQNLSTEVIKTSLYISIFLGILFLFFSLLSYLEKRKVERKSTNYDNF